MNLAESMKYVLKNKSRTIFSFFTKEDLKKTIKDFGHGIVATTQQKKDLYKRFSFKESISDISGSFQGAVLLVRAIPQRVNEGFRIFSNEMTLEMDKLPDQKQKTVFCMKVLAGLSKFAVSSAYEVGLGDAKLLGLGKSRKMVSSVIISKIMFKTIQTFIIRMIQEMEKELTDPEELKNLQNLKKIIMDNSANAIDKIFEGITDSNDRAFVIVNNFKNYILTGQQVTV
jgi:hypothetical protein